ncbi:MAG: serine/threonine protein kinase [Gemmatimonadales bacterium]|nr:serine/threonine protein kinase [Gemmatimonadales bacterium]
MSTLRCPRCGTTFDPPARFCTKDGFSLVPGGAPPPTTTRAFGLHRTGEVRQPPARRGDPASGLSGRVLDGRYQMEMRVGEGGMAYVYRAKDRENGKTVAVKVLMSRLTGDHEAVARLRREAQVAMRLDHPNVCGIQAFGEAAGMPYLVMPFLEGETLSRRETRHGPMPAPLAVPLLRQLCRGLQHAHDAGVLHRDLKPENVMLVADGGVEHAVVMDFGLAKESVAGAEVVKLTATGIVLGTPEFMSPEQIRGKPLDARSDVFALGVLAFELLTGRLPFEGNTAQETMLAHLTGQPLRLRQANAALPESLERVIAESIAHKPNDRFQRMSDFEEALGDCVGGSAASQ